MEKGTDQESTQTVAVECLHFCTHAFLDSHGRPCLNGLLYNIRCREFPISIGSVTVAAALSTTPNREIIGRLELGRPDGPAERWYDFKRQASPDGLIWLRIQTISLFFRNPQVLQARIRIGNDQIGSRSVNVLAFDQRPG
jgi:hypothetical protein